MVAPCLLALSGLALAGRPLVTPRTRGAAMRVVSDVEPCTDIFCNRAINMAHIQAHSVAIARDVHVEADRLSWLGLGLGPG